MANQEHLDRLLQGVKAWNQWRQENSEIKPDLSQANLSQADLRFADLRQANLGAANLNHANLSHASFSDADLDDADLRFADLSHANLGAADLRFADFRFANLSAADFSDANLLSAYLSSANLSHANLSSADLSHANLSSADLSHANLIAVQALQANFQTTTLTGACIQDWNINSSTNLQEVICEYIFTKYDWQKGQFTDRRPHDPDQIFAPGEFTKRYQIVLESVELFFNDGIDWKAFLVSLHDLQAQYGDELSIRDIGKRAGGSFVVQLEVPPNADKGIIERAAKELYQTKLQTLEAYYEERLQLKGEQLSFFKEQVEIERIRNTRLERIVETMAEKESAKYDLRGSNFGGGFAAEGGTQTGGTFNEQP